MKIGIIGLGFMGVTHVRALRAIPGCELVAVAATNRKALAGDLSAAGGNLGEAAGRLLSRTAGSKTPSALVDFSGVRTYENWRDLLADREVEAVDICLPTDLHCEVAVAALSSGKDALCEKPMALDERGCGQMVAAAGAHGRVLMIAHVLRFWPEYEGLERFVCERGSKLRALHFARSCGLPDWSRWLPDAKRSGGAILDLLIHDIDQAIWLRGMPEFVEARSHGAVDTMTATLGYRGGLEITIEGGWLPAGAPFAMSFAAHTETAALRFASGAALSLTDETGERLYPSTSSDAYRAELAYFAACCQTRQQPGRCPPEQSAQAVRLALLLKHSRELGGKTIRCSD